MRDNEGYEIRHNGVPRSFRDVKESAYEAARFAKSRNPSDIIEIIDRSTTLSPMLADGRTCEVCVIAVYSPDFVGINCATG